MIKESSSFYPEQQTSLLCLISKYMTAVAGAHYSYIAARNFNYYRHCTLYSKGHFDSCCSKHFFPLTIEVGLVDNSILFSMKSISFEMYR